MRIFVTGATGYVGRGNPKGIDLLTGIRSGSYRDLAAKLRQGAEPARV